MTPALLDRLAPDGLTTADVAELEDIPERSAVIVLEHHRRHGRVRRDGDLWVTTRLEWDRGSAQVGRLRLFAWHGGWQVWRWCDVTRAEIVRAAEEGLTLALSTLVASGWRRTLDESKAAAEAVVAGRTR